MFVNEFGFLKTHLATVVIKNRVVTLGISINIFFDVINMTVMHFSRSIKYLN